MTSEQNVRMLIEEIREGRFDAERLSLELTVQVNLGLREFYLYDQRAFGNERMKYRLEFTKDPGGIYHFSSLRATFRKAIILFNSPRLKVQELDELMGSIDWKAYFKHPLSGNKWEQNPEKVSQVFKALRKLGESEERSGIDDYYSLIYKHWPEEISKLYMGGKLAELISVYENGWIFTKDKGEILDAVTSYQILSGLYEDLKAKVKSIELEEKGIEIDALLLPAIRYNPDSLKLEYSGYDTEFFFQTNIKLEKCYDAYVFDDYEIEIAKYPEMIHGVYDGIDTDKLEQEFRLIPKLVSQYKEENSHLYNAGEIESVKKVLDTLHANPYGKATAQVLELKYLTCSSQLKELVSDSAWKLLRELERTSYSFPSHIPVDAALNLIAGRAIFDIDMQCCLGSNNHWLIFDKVKSSEDLNLVSVEGVSLLEIENQLKAMRITPMDAHEALEKILKGHHASVVMENRQEFTIKVDPQNKTFEWCDVNGQLIKKVPFVDPENGKSVSPMLRYPIPGARIEAAKKSPSKSKRKGRSI